MSHTQTQQTFLSYAEFLSRASRCCIAAEHALRQHLPEVEQPFASGMALIADTEHELAMQIAKYGRNGPEDIISTRLQYSPDLVPPGAVDTPGEALCNVTRTNLELTRAVADLATSAAHDTLGDTLRLLADEIEAVNRRISTIRVTARDA